MVDFEIKDCYKFDDLLRIMEILRAPDGCMWDREQDHPYIYEGRKQSAATSSRRPTRSVKPLTTRTPSI